MARASGPRHVLAAILTLAVVLGGCAQAAPTVAPRGSGTEPAMPRIPDEQAPPLVIYFRSEPASLATRSLGQKSASVRTQIHPFNALLASMDDHARPRPELLASLPELHGPSWIVNADGTMETTYALRSGLTWHDGQPLTSGDIVFSWRVYSSPDLSYSKQPPFSAISDVTALDAERFVIRWTMPYPDAHSLSEREREFPPLPEHILGPAFDQMSATGAGAFANQPFWTTQYVGAGPFRLQNWEAGSSIRAVRVATYPLGKPKIPRIEERFSDDQNVVVAHLLAGTAQAATASALPDVPEALNEQWSRSRAGRVFSSPTSWQQLTYQLRPDYASPRAILDPRIRKGIAQSIDKRAISDAVFSGQAVFSDNPIWKGSGWGDALDDSIPTYPFDPRAA
ncbi:MAG TPA: ABC transporter substrate-binding protein, partial [Chloroflexota bacterium]|nr:ABC transporter substrate-binding protein [Chloroflexota bacterium]